MKSGIYQIMNTVNGKRYIGSAMNFHIRWKRHLNYLNKNKHHSIKLQRAWNKYGEDAFEFIILLKCAKEELIIKEQSFIDWLKPEYNVCKQAGSPAGIIFTDERKLKISVALTGNKNAIGNTHNLGRRASKETRNKMSKSFKGRIVSEETRNKISNSLKGHVHSEETKNKIGRKGRIVSVDVRINISNKLKGRTFSEESKHNMSEAAKLRCFRKKEQKDILAVWSCAL